MSNDIHQPIEEVGIKPISAEVTMIPQTMTELTNEDDVKKMDILIDMLEEDDDVQNVWHNCDN